MKFNAESRRRRSIRLKEYDYSQPGAYFVTICTNGRQCLFGDIVDDEMVLNGTGVMVQQVWNSLPGRFQNIESDQFVVMPNHIHSIIVLTGNGRGESCIRPHSIDHKKGDHKDRPYGTLPGTLGRVVQAFKSITAKKYIDAVKQWGWSPSDRRLWQRNYYEHVIRNEAELDRVRRYIEENPIKWALDRENPIAQLTRAEEPWQV
jgi:REP element-mobilizing transposase RayT